jgi:hypothetical protein
MLGLPQGEVLAIGESDHVMRGDVEAVVST